MFSSLSASRQHFIFASFALPLMQREHTTAGVAIFADDAMPFFIFAVYADVYTHALRYVAVTVTEYAAAEYA